MNSPFPHVPSETNKYKENENDIFKGNKRFGDTNICICCEVLLIPLL